MKSAEEKYQVIDKELKENKVTEIDICIAYHVSFVSHPSHFLKNLVRPIGVISVTCSRTYADRDESILTDSMK